MKKKYLVCIGILVSIIIMFSFTYSYAIDSDEIWGEASRLSSAGNTIVNTIIWVGVVILVGAVIYKGIKFVTAAPDGKAEIKKEIIMLVIGGVLLFGLAKIIDIILSLVQSAGLH